MHYYQFNIGDYHSHTKHLNPIEDIAYRRLLDEYYLHERPLSVSLTAVARQINMREHEAEIKIVLEEFFQLADDGWINERADREITHYHSKVEQASRAGKASAERRLNARSTDVQPTNNQEPITNNQEPDIQGANAPLSGTKFPDCPHTKILALWAKHMPHLPQPRIWEGNRQEGLRARWRQASKPSEFSATGYKTEAEGLAWWDSFFSYLAKDTKLSKGFETNGRVWVPDMAWIVKAENFQKIIDGKYDK
jgi:uncharacterized protein YdaU (DUF1376 family)